MTDKVPARCKTGVNGEGAETEGGAGSCLVASDGPLIKEERCRLLLNFNQEFHSTGSGWMRGGPVA